MRNLFTVKRIVVGVIVGVLVIVIVALAFGSHGSNITAVQPTAAPTTPAPAPTTAAPSSPAPLTTEPLGGAFQDTGQNDAGNNFAYNVTATQVDQHAKFSNSYGSLTNPGTHLVAVQFKLTEVSGSESDDSNSDAVVVGTDGQDYDATFDTVADGTNFNSGEFDLSAGQSVTGWVSFELPAGVSAAQVQWAPGFGGNTATWTVS